jgi:hypothetical protein
MTAKTHITRIAATIAALTTMMGVSLANPPLSRATDGSSGSSYFCPSTNPWLCKGGIAGYKCFQYSNCTGASASARRS